MARARGLKPALFKNELLGVADPLLTLLFVSLWTLADKSGRLEDRPLRIKAETFPYRENLDINESLTQLYRLGFIVRYVVAGQALIQVVNFEKHQTPHSTEKSSVLLSLEHGTAIDCGKQEITGISALDLRENVIALPPDLLTPDSFNLTTSSLTTDTALRAESASALPSLLKIAEQRFELPDWINAEHWHIWHTSPKRKKATNPQKRLALSKLAGWREKGLDFAGALENAAVGGNQGLFLPNVPFCGTGRAQPAETTYQRSKRELYERAIGRNKKPILEIFDEPLELQNEFAVRLD